MKPSPRPLDWYDAKTEPPTEADEDDNGCVSVKHCDADTHDEYSGSLVRSHSQQFDKWCPLPKAPPYPEPTPEPEDDGERREWTGVTYIECENYAEDTAAITVREVKPGDPTMQQVREAVKSMRISIRLHEEGFPLTADVVARWINILEGK